MQTVQAKDDRGYTHNVNTAQIVSFYATSKTVHIITSSGDQFTYEGKETELIRSLGA